VRNHDLQNVYTRKQLTDAMYEKSGDADTAASRFATVALNSASWFSSGANELFADENASLIVANVWGSARNDAFNAFA